MISERYSKRVVEETCGNLFENNNPALFWGEREPRKISFGIFSVPAGIRTGL
jgi:hypothetical protein